MEGREKLMGKGREFMEGGGGEGGSPGKEDYK